jgi:hypothetical protein
MTLVQGNDVDPTDLAFHPALCDAVLPEAFERSTNRNDPERPDRRGNFKPIFPIPVEDKKSRRRFEWKGLPQLAAPPTDSSDAGSHWKCRMRLRSWLITKKLWSSPNVIVGTVKKSIAAIASR